MCGRYGRGRDPSEIADELGWAPFDEVRIPPPQWNIPPGTFQPVGVHGRERIGIALMKWGLVPSWAKSEKASYSTINARAETVAERPTYRGAWQAGRRCAVIADGFFEWQKSPNGAKQPHWIRVRGGPLFAFAGLWEKREGLLSFTIVTCPAAHSIAHIHERMPVILADADARAAWLDPRMSSDDVAGLLRPLPAEWMEAWPVTTRVNSPRNQGADLVAPLG